MTPRDFIAGFIGTHEGGLSLNKSDNGNWFDPARYKANQPQRRDCGELVGSKFGVTAYALARYRHCDDIEKWEMASLTIAEAIEVGLQLYYRAPRFDLLPWNRVTASIVDKGWGSGPGTATQMLQSLIGVLADGKIGPATAARYSAWLAKMGEEGAARAWAAVREAKDKGIATNEGANDPDRIFLKGWNNRTLSFLPGTVWWNGWDKVKAS